MAESQKKSYNVGNQYAVGNNGGRPAHFEKTEDLIKKVDDYFIWVKGESHPEQRTITEKDEDGKPTKREVTVTVWDRDPEHITITGLALFLGFSSRSSFRDYELRGDEFSHIIKKAKMLVEHNYEKCLFDEKPTGAIFALKNMGWADRSEVDISTLGQPLNNAPIAKLEDGTEIEL